MDHEYGSCNDEQWQVRKHAKLLAPDSLPPGNLPEILNEHEATFKAVAFAPDDSCIARIVRLNRVVVNAFRRGGDVGPDKIIKCQTHLSCLAFGPVLRNMYLVKTRTTDSCPPETETSLINGQQHQNGGGLHQNRHPQSYPSFVLATGHKNGSIRLWDAWSTQLITTLMSHRQRVTDMMFSHRTVGADGNPLLISVSTDKKLNVWDGEYHGYNMSFSLNTPMIGFCCDFHPSNRFFALAGSNRTAEAYDIFEREADTGGGGGRGCVNTRVMLKHKLHGHSAGVVRCKYTPDGSFLLTASWDTTVCMWDSYSGALCQTFCHVYPPPTLLFSTQLRDVTCDASFSAVATVNSEGTLTVWNPFRTPTVAAASNHAFDNNKAMHHYKRVVTEPEVAMQLGQSCQYTTLTFSHTNNYLLLSDDEGNATVYTLQRPVLSLAHQCRSKIRSLMLDRLSSASASSAAAAPSSNINHQLMEELGMPKTLQSYLKYEAVIPALRAS